MSIKKTHGLFLYMVFCSFIWFPVSLYGFLFLNTVSSLWFSLLDAQHYSRFTLLEGKCTLSYVLINKILYYFEHKQLRAYSFYGLFKIFPWISAGYILTGIEASYCPFDSLWRYYAFYKRHCFPELYLLLSTWVCLLILYLLGFSDLGNEFPSLSAAFHQSTAKPEACKGFMIILLVIISFCFVKRYSTGNTQFTIPSSYFTGGPFYLKKAVHLKKKLSIVCFTRCFFPDQGSILSYIWLSLYLDSLL